jgi:hypothetical protein
MIRKQGDMRITSDPGDSEDESLCGSCAGTEMYASMEENEKLEAELARVTAERDEARNDTESAVLNIPTGIFGSMHLLK